MEHKIIPAMWKSKKGLIKIVKAEEENGWSVSALGEVFGGPILVLVRDGQTYEHDFVQVLLKTREKVDELITQKGTEGWQVCAIGECLSPDLMILKRKKS